MFPTLCRTTLSAIHKLLQLPPSDLEKTEYHIVVRGMFQSWPTFVSVLSLFFFSSVSSFAQK